MTLVKASLHTCVSFNVTSLKSGRQNCPYFEIMKAQGSLEFKLTE